MKTIQLVLKLLVAAIFAIGIDQVLFITSGGIEFIQQHGKLLPVFVGILNVIVGGAISGAFFSPDVKSGFKLWLQPTRIRGSLNPTHAFATIILLWNVLIVTVFIEA